MAEHPRPGAVVPGGANPNYQRADLGSAVLWFLENEKDPRQVSPAHPLPMTGADPEGIIAAVAALGVKLDAMSAALATQGGTAMGAISVYRNAVAAADLVARVGTITHSAVNGGGLTAGTYNVQIAAGKTNMGRTDCAAVTPQATSGSNLTYRAAFAQVANADWYDVMCSTDAAPKWAGRITEAQRAAGCVISAVGVVGAGGTPGAVDIQAIGTGGTAPVVNTAFVLPDDVGIDCSGKRYCHFGIVLSRTGDLVAPALVVVPFFKEAAAIWTAGRPEILAFGGVANLFQPMPQTLRYEVRGRRIQLAVALIAGTGALATIYAGQS